MNHIAISVDHFIVWKFVCLFVTEEIPIKVSRQAPDKEARPSPYHYCSLLLGRCYHLTSLQLWSAYFWSLFLQHLVIPGFPQSDYTHSKLSPDAGSLWHTVKQAWIYIVLKCSTVFLASSHKKAYLHTYMEVLNQGDLSFWVETEWFNGGLTKWCTVRTPFTPPRTPRISRLKSQIMNPTFLS